MGPGLAHGRRQRQPEPESRCTPRTSEASADDVIQPSEPAMAEPSVALDVAEQPTSGLDIVVVNQTSCCCRSGRIFGYVLLVGGVVVMLLLAFKVIQ